RHQDIPQAKSLLRRAGHSKLTLQLVTGDIAGGIVEACQVFAANAAQAGVKININNQPAGVVFGPNYLKWPFSVSDWPYGNYVPTAQLATVPKTAPYNETHWNVAKYAALYKQADATPDPAKRKAILQEMMMMDFTSGGYIIPVYVKVLDLTTSK